jgi:lysophospholipase L1-like esterase
MAKRSPTQKRARRPRGSDAPVRSHAPLLAALSLALCLVVLEMCVRVFFHDEVDTLALRQRLGRHSIRIVVEPSPDPTVFFDLRPNLRLTFAGSLVVTAAGRYRISGAEGPAARAPAQVRIAVLGDSTPFGWGVAYEDSYPERFRRRLEDASGRSVELRNFSVPGYNALQELRAFETKVKPWRPHLLIVHHDHNDADPAVKAVSPDYMPPEYGDNPLQSALIKWTRRRLRRMRNESDRTAAASGHRLVGGYIAAGPLYDAQLEARRALLEQARALGTPVLIVLFNAVVTRNDGYERTEVYITLHRDLAAKLAHMGYRVLDLYPLYQQALQERGWADMSRWWRSLKPVDAHPNPDGHRFIAERLADYTLGDAGLSSALGLGAAGQTGTESRVR